MTTLTTTISITEDRCSLTDDGGGGVVRAGDTARYEETEVKVGETETKLEDSSEKKYSQAESETEDEEVKLNCIGGARGMDESDIYSDCEEVDMDKEADTSSDESDAEETRSEWYVLFGYGKLGC
jgi:hypothetical protein